MLKGEQLELVSEYIYLGSTITEDGKCGGDIRKCIGLASGVISRLSKDKGACVQSIDSACSGIWL